MKRFVVLLIFSFGLFSGDYSSSDDSDDENSSSEGEGDEPTYRGPPPDIFLPLTVHSPINLEAHYTHLFGIEWKNVYNAHILNPFVAREKLKEICFKEQATIESAEKKRNSALELLKLFPSQNTQ